VVKVETSNAGGAFVACHEHPKEQTIPWCKVPLKDVTVTIEIISLPPDPERSTNGIADSQAISLSPLCGGSALFTAVNKFCF
jgi:hypothetical protein